MYVFIVFKLCVKTFVYTENDDVQVFRMYQYTARRLFKAMFTALKSTHRSTCILVLLIPDIDPLILTCITNLPMRLTPSH